MKTALLLLAHGSPHASANEAVYAVSDAVRALRRFDLVQVGFLDCNEPDIPSAIDQCVANGAGRLIALPYFLHTGNHVAEDLPNLLDEARARHPGVDFRLAEYLGSSPKLTDILARRAVDALKRSPKAR